MRITYQELLDNPQLFARLRKEAHRERARVVSELFRKLFAIHAPRAHLARQG